MLPDSFMEQVNVRADECWEWTGPRYPNGYGRYQPDEGRASADGRDARVLAHRFAHEATKGPIRDVVNHLCENKWCVNPEHLEDVTQQENVRYSLSDTCKNGHDLTIGSPNVWIDEKQNKRKCRACMRDSKRREYERAPEKFRSRRAEFYSENRASILAQKREYYLKNREAILARRHERSLAKRASQS